MTAGRPPTPTEQKRRRGTFRADRSLGAANLAAQGSLAVVEPVEHGPLDKPLNEVIERVLARGVHWLGETDAPAIVLLRELVDERIQLAEIVSAIGNRDDRKSLRDIDKQIMDLLGQLGFTPAARARLGLAEVKAQSTLEKLRARQAAAK